MDIDELKRQKLEKIKQLEKELLKQPQAELEVKHAFLDGVYCRQLFIPKGTVFTGKTHRFETCNIMPKGKLAVVNDSEESLIEAPCMFISPPGTKKAAIALEDTLFINVHISDSTDLDRLESELIINESEQIETDEAELLCHG